MEHTLDDVLQMTMTPLNIDLVSLYSKVPEIDSKTQNIVAKHYQLAVCYHPYLPTGNLFVVKNPSIS